MQGRGRRWPKKKPSGSESEEEEQVEQGTSSLGSRGVSKGPCSRPLGASALSPARHSCSGLDPCSTLWVSGLELAVAAFRRAASGTVRACSGTRSPPSTLSSPDSPAPGWVRHALLRAPSLFPTSQRGGPLKPDPGSRPAPGPCARLYRGDSSPGLPAPPRLRPPEGGRVPSLGAESRAAVEAAARGGFGRPLEHSGLGHAVRAAGPETRVWEVRLLGSRALLQGRDRVRPGRGSHPGRIPSSAQPKPLPPSLLICTFPLLPRDALPSIAGAGLRPAFK